MQYFFSSNISVIFLPEVVVVDPLCEFLDLLPLHRSHLLLRRHSKTFRIRPPWRGGRSTRASKRHNSPLWKLLQLFDALLGDLHVVGGEDIDDLLQRFEDVVVRCLLLLHHLQELHLPEQYSLYVSLAIKVSFAVQDKDKYSKIYIVDIKITVVLCKLEKMNKR